MKRGAVRWGGHRPLKIYGRLDCWSGRRMLRRNRVFFVSLEEAETWGYRPCGHCMKEKYKEWISSRVTGDH
ncbi:MAG: Ada metal-binding domain-containing protein [Planctomycetota bacterium]|nr:Ada metal-binding domain-containing protein [Planctomycetota bacterium]